MAATTRFSDRVDDYVRARPGYPPAVLDVLRREAGLTPASVVADIGSGTGLSADPFLANGNIVYGVEPNAAMRAAAEQRFAGEARFRSTAGTAEATTLPDACADLVVAAQAFHWFDVAGARREFARILRPGGSVALVWNERLLGGTLFLSGYEALLQRYGTDYRDVHTRTLDAARIEALFAGGRVALRRVPNAQRLDADGLRARLLSSSYTPAEGHPDRAPMLDALGRLFDETQDGGTVCVEYDTRIYVGRVDDRTPAPDRP